MNAAFKALAAVLALVLASAAIYLWINRAQPGLAELVQEAPQTVREFLAPPVPPAPPVSPPAPAPPPIAHPVEPPPEQSPPLPSLAQSDEDMLRTLGGVVEPAVLSEYLQAPGLIRRIVASVDNLTGGKVSTKISPLKPVPGAFLVDGDDEQPVLSPRNFARYTPLVEVLERIDPAVLTAVYVRFYPLFQQAYRELGYPDGYFNDRLVGVIDDLLSVPQVEEPIALVQPNVLYRYADPALENLPAGQKILLRMGPDNASRVRRVLTAWRAAITARDGGTGTAFKSAD